MSAPRHAARPRYGRIVAACASAVVTAVAVLAGIGIVPTGGASAQVGQRVADPVAPRVVRLAAPREPTAAEHLVPHAQRADPHRNRVLPAESGQGRRVVFSESRQRVWLVDDAGEVRRTYLVSGSTLDNLDPGTYEVWSTSRWAVGIDDSGVMEYFVRFTRGPSGAAIGFHTIPTKDGTALQTVDDLGTPQSSGCIRQRTADAIAMWEFAPVGTTVVVTV